MEIETKAKFKTIANIGWQAVVLGFVRDTGSVSLDKWAPALLSGAPSYYLGLPLINRGLALINRGLNPNDCVKDFFLSSLSSLCQALSHKTPVFVAMGTMGSESSFELELDYYLHTR